MKDYMTTQERMADLNHVYLREGFKEAMVTLVCVVVFFILLTQPNGVI